MPYLRYLCCVCAYRCPTYIALCFCFVCLRLVSCVYVASFSVLSILIAPSVFSNVYVINKTKAHMPILQHFLNMHVDYCRM